MRHLAAVVVLGVLVSAGSLESQSAPAKEPSVLETVLNTVLEREVRRLENSITGSSSGGMASAENWLGVYTGPVRESEGGRQRDVTTDLSVVRQKDGTLCLYMNLQYGTPACQLLPSGAQLSWTWYGSSHQVNGTLVREPDGRLRLTRTVRRQFPDGTTAVTITSSGVLYRK